MMSEAQLPSINTAWLAQRWTVGLTFVALALQIGLALLLNHLRQGQEFANDVAEYRDYIEHPFILVEPLPPGKKLIGGRVAAPLLPLLLVPIHMPLKWLGANDLLAFRGTMIFWNTLGLGITLWEIFRRWGTPRTKRESWLALGVVCSPLTWMPSAVLAQDDTVAAFWCALCFVCWSRWGVWGCWVAAALGLYTAKPFLVVYFAALWMAYSAQRKSLVAGSILALGGLLGFMYWRDGELRLLRHSVQTYMNGSLYSLDWLIKGDATLEAAQLHRTWAKQIAFWPTVIALGGYALSAWGRLFTFPSAIVGLYCVMFSVMVGMMPEYELWLWSWSILLIWLAIQRGLWLLGGLLYVHSILGYAYKFFYSCDSKNFFVLEPKPTAIWYDREIGWDLWWVMASLSVLLFINTLWLAILLWRKYPRLCDEGLPSTA